MYFSAFFVVSPSIALLCRGLLEVAGTAARRPGAPAARALLAAPAAVVDGGHGRAAQKLREKGEEAQVQEGTVLKSSCQTPTETTDVKRPERCVTLDADADAVTQTSGLSPLVRATTFAFHLRY